MENPTLGAHRVADELILTRVQVSSAGAGVWFRTSLRMFDRGFISIDDDYTLLSKRNAIPGSVLSLVNSDRRLRLPDQGIYYSHPRLVS